MRLNPLPRPRTPTLDYIVSEPESTQPVPLVRSMSAPATPAAEEPSRPLRLGMLVELERDHVRELAKVRRRHRVVVLIAIALGVALGFEARPLLEGRPVTSE